MGLRVMVLVAHADDETLGAGGYIPLLVDRGHNVSVVVVSDCLIAARESSPDNRPSLYEACGVLGVDDIHVLGYADQQFDTYSVADIANSVLSLNIDPGLIISHVDTDLNNDHRITADVAKIAGRPRNKPVGILGCEIPNGSAWNSSPFAANYFVDIESTVEKKVEAFSRYKNEIKEPPDPLSAEGLLVLAQFRGMECGYRYAEAFHVVRMFDQLVI